MATLALSSSHRRELRTLTGLAEADLAKIWREFNTAEAAREGLMDVLPQLVSIYGAAAATLASDYYDELRDAAEVGGSFRAIPAVPAGVERTDVLARFAVGPLFQASQDWASALVLAQGGLQRTIANADRLTVTGSSVQDRRARGWRRTGKGDCEFCSMLLSRGAVYTEATADFRAHDHCGCAAEPVFA